MDSDAIMHADRPCAEGYQAHRSLDVWSQDCRRSTFVYGGKEERFREREREAAVLKSLA